MTIKGLNNATTVAIDRARRTNESICIVQIADNEYVLWRWITQDNIALIYTYYKIVKVIGYKDDFR